jgi:hypothetical protein
MEMRDRLLIMVILRLLDKPAGPGRIEQVYEDCVAETGRWQDFEMQRKKRTD